jgi:hypothetical protein
MKKLLTLLFISFFFISFSLAQEDDIVEEESVSIFGPNNTHFMHPYIHLGFMSSPTEGEGGDINYGKSHDFTVGLKYKLRFTDVFAIGAALNYTYYVWNIKQVDTKLIPNSNIYNKQKILTNNLGFDLFFRLNVDKRGNTVGNFIDLGAYGEWAYNNAEKYYMEYDEASDPTAFDSYVGIRKNLVFIEDLNYGVFAKFGYGKYVLFGKYRLSDMFTPEYKAAVADTELPRLLVGVELGLHK